MAKDDTTDTTELPGDNILTANVDQTPTSSDPAGDAKARDKAAEASTGGQTTAVAAKAKKSEKVADFLEKFLNISGYSAEDVIAQNTPRRTFVTSNGGKYQLRKDGIRRIAGPSFPNQAVG